MLMSKRKTKMLSVRLTWDQFQRLQEASDAGGYLNVSDYARAALFALAGRTAPSLDPVLDRKLEFIQTRLESLTSDLADITNAVAKDPQNA
jgi:Arc/MetJ-type ribon-helix-helix transcriptional regulator